MSKEETPAVEPKKSAPKPEKKAKKKEEKGAKSLYKIEGEKVTRLRPTCERCGPGYFMAKHQDRYTCGHCGFTRYKQVEQ
jgi:small subunit ribosomal protein S27Ae